MNKSIIACRLGLPGLLAVALALPAMADVPAVPAEQTTSSSASLDLPARGEAQAKVLQRHGEPQSRHPAVGGGSKAQPRITRWDYPGFSVFFENQHVVDAVVPGQPAPLFNTDELGAAGAEQPGRR